METSRLIEEDGVLIDCLVPRHSWLSLNVVVETFVISGGLDWTVDTVQDTGSGWCCWSQQRSQAATTQLLLPAFPAITQLTNITVKYRKKVNTHSL